MALAKRNERQVKPNLHVSPPLRTRVLPSPLRRSREHLYHVGFRQSIVAARIFCRVVMRYIEINAAGLSTAGQSVQFRSRAKLATTW